MKTQLRKRHGDVNFRVTSQVHNEMYPRGTCQLSLRIPDGYTYVNSIAHMSFSLNRSVSQSVDGWLGCWVLGLFGVLAGWLACLLLLADSLGWAACLVAICLCLWLAGFVACCLCLWLAGVILEGVGRQTCACAVTVDAGILFRGQTPDQGGRDLG